MLLGIFQQPHSSIIYLKYFYLVDFYEISPKISLSLQVYSNQGVPPHNPSCHRRTRLRLARGVAQEARTFSRMAGGFPGENPRRRQSMEGDPQPILPQRAGRRLVKSQECDGYESRLWRVCDLRSSSSNFFQGFVTSSAFPELDRMLKPTFSARKNV